ncbi:hypothetical protein BX600DRAFT_510612 [Xylariales sp. PMI_506]|nr:hypothetical protein BX600DRAFT_510612 [Xylariales sp. PMI_506]
MEKSELLAFAREYSNSVDLYELLGIDSIKAKEPQEVQRAYRKQSIKYHPDKTGPNFDPDKWQLLERGRDVLMDAASKEAYDSARSAALAREEQRRAMDAKKRSMIEDLEARERGEDPKRMKHNHPDPAAAAARQEHLRKGRQIVEERARMMREAEEREQRRARTEAAPTTTEKKQEVPSQPAAADDAGSRGNGYDDQIADLERRLQEARERKAAKKAARKNGTKPPSAEDEAAPIKNPVVSDSKADEKKVFTFSAPSSTPQASIPPSRNERFTLLQQRLKAAQAEKERKKAESAIGIAGAAPTPTDE